MILSLPLLVYLVGFLLSVAYSYYHSPLVIHYLIMCHTIFIRFFIKRDTTCIQNLELFFFFSGGIFVPYYDTTLLDIHILYKYSTVNDEKTERKAIYMYAFCIKIRVILQVILL